MKALVLVVALLTSCDWLPSRRNVNVVDDALARQALTALARSSPDVHTPRMTDCPAIVGGDDTGGIAYIIYTGLNECTLRFAYQWTSTPMCAAYSYYIGGDVKTDPSKADLVLHIGDGLVGWACVGE